MSAETKLAVYTIVVRVPADAETGWSIYGVETKRDYFSEVVDSSVIELPEGEA